MVIAWQPAGVLILPSQRSVATFASMIMLRTSVLTAVISLVACSINPEPKEAESSRGLPSEARSAQDHGFATTEEGRAPSTPTPADPLAEAPDGEPVAALVVVPMTVQVDDQPLLELRSDRSVYSKNKKVAWFHQNVMQLVLLKISVSVLPDGSIITQPGGRSMRFNDEDELELEGVGSLAIDGTGKVSFSPVAGGRSRKVTITGFKPEGRRAAALTAMIQLALAAKFEP
ncbi:MAG: hypothetical protein KC731_18540 [Myxococcales bacterium]|nr:hypothetical protein [Myxococcales bacterium]